MSMERKCGLGNDTARQYIFPCAAVKEREGNKGKEYLVLGTKGQELRGGEQRDGNNITKEWKQRENSGMVTKDGKTKAHIKIKGNLETGSKGRKTKGWE